MWAGGHYSDFKPVERARKALRNSRLPRPLPPIRALEGVGLKFHIFTVLHLKSDNFGENLKIHVGSDDKLRIQFAPPKHYKLKVNCITYSLPSIETATITMQVLCN